MANLTYEERVALEQQKEALRRQRENERRNGVAGVRANDSRITSNLDAMHGKAGRKWLGGESGAVSSGDALHGMAGRKWLSGGEPQTQSHSRITAFSTSGNGDATWYDNMDPIGARAKTAAWEAERALRDRVYADQRSSFDEMAQVMEVSKRKKAQQQISLANDIAAMMKFSNGGVIPNELRELVNRRYGWDGVKTGILPQSGFTVDGSFNIIIGNGDDGMGNVATQIQSFNPFQQYQIMNLNQAAFDDNDRGALRQRLIDSGYSEKELGVFEQQGANWRRDLAEQKQKQSNDAAKRKEMGERISQMQAYLKDLNNIEIYPDQGSEEVEAEKKNIREQLAQARREYFQRPGAAGQPAPTQTVDPAPQGGGLTSPQGKPVAENVNVPEAGGGKPEPGGASPSAVAPTATNPQGGTANGGTEADAIRAELDRRAAMRGGQKLLNVVRGGRNVTMNGYEHNGRFYDAKGNLMTDVEDTFEVEGAPTEVEVSDEELAANPKMRTFTRRGEDGSMKRYRRDFSSVRYVRSKDRAKPQGGTVSDSEEPAATPAPAPAPAKTQGGNVKETQKPAATPAPTERKPTQAGNATSHGLAKELGIDQSFVDQLAAEDDEFDADDVSDDFKLNWLGNADNAITKLYNYARIEGRKDVMSAIDKYISDGRAKREQAEIDRMNKLLSRHEEDSRLTLKQSLDEMQREVRREAISKGKDTDWIKSEIENRSRDIERRHRTTHSIRYDINGNPIM